MVRSFPIGLEPAPGEALDSWIEALCHRMSTSWGDVAGALGLLTKGPGSTPWLARLSQEQLEALSLATGYGRPRLDAMTLTRYDGKAVCLHPSTNAVDRAFPWSRARFSRFCPQCLQSSGGRWQLFWRLGWAFACLEHHCLLADECPQCQQRQRTRPTPSDVIPNPGHCASQAVNASGRAPARCSADLAAVTTLQLPDTHPALIAQRTIIDLIDSATAAFGIYRERPVAGPDALADIRAVAGRILAYANDGELAARIPPDVHRAYRELRSRSSPITSGIGKNTKPGLQAPATAVTAAVGVTAAMDILAAPDIAAAASQMRWLVGGARARGLTVNATTIGWGKGTTPTLTAAQLTTLAPLLKPGDQLRYHVGNRLPAKPSRPEAASAALAARLPGSLWPEWSVRLRPPQADHRFFGAALMCAVLLVDTRNSWGRAAELLGSQIWYSTAQRAVARLNALPCWPTIREALTRLADHLYRTTSPIDYRRRRTLDYSTLLPDDIWKRICRNASQHPGGTVKATLARTHLYTAVSGNPARQAPWFTPALTVGTSAFPIRLTPEVATGLHEQAATFLDDHRIDEPVHWSPSADILAGLDLPGIDPDAVNIAALHRLTRQQLSIGAIAARLDVSSESVGYILTRAPAPDPARTKAQQRCRAEPIARLERFLGRERFMDLYLRQGMSLRDIAALYSTSRQTVTRLAQRYQIEALAPGRRRRHPEVERAWIYTEYIVKQRSLPELAADKAMSTTSMRRWARFHGIACRGPGGPSHRAYRAERIVARTAPRILEPALRGIGGTRRLAQFAAASQYTNLAAAASALQVPPSRLSTQIRRLAQELGSPLINPARRARSMTLTPHGRAVLAAYLDWAPRPSDLPDAHTDRNSAHGTDATCTQ